MRSDHIGAVAALVASLSAAGGQDRTAAALRALSPADAYHSMLFNGLGTGRILDSQNSVHVISSLAQIGEPPPVRGLLAGLFCSTDATFSGTVTGMRSHPSSDGTFLFTTYWNGSFEATNGLVQPLSPEFQWRFGKGNVRR